ncbi:MAG: hypothetical protein FJ088_04740 [Deltaproteobacteria bacterium]|nr:hypothetical protein [Deltaproteobacteria bacterium]
MDKRLLTITIAAIILGTITFAGYFLLSGFVKNDPMFCAHCHQMRETFEIWTDRSHKKITCQSCHHTDAARNLSLLVNFLLSDTVDVGTHASVRVSTCVSCHASHDPKWIQIGESIGHRTHHEKQKIECTACHSSSSHKFEPPIQICGKCHEDHIVKAKGMERFHCLTCHNFLTVDKNLKPSRKDCLKCHQNEGLRKGRFDDDAPMQFICNSCHHPHLEKEPSLISCEKCHEKIPEAGLHSLAGHKTDCTSCHEAHLWKSNAENCRSCHKKLSTHFPNKSCNECHSFRNPI